VKRVWPLYAASWATTGLTTSIGTLGVATTAGIAAGTVAAGAGIAAINRRKAAKTGTGLLGRPGTGRSGGLLGSRSAGIGRSGGTGRLARAGRSMGLGRPGSKPAGRSVGKPLGRSAAKNPIARSAGRSGRPTASAGRSTKPKSKSTGLFGRSGPGGKPNRSTKGHRPTSSTKNRKKKSSWWGDDKSINAISGVVNEPTDPKTPTTPDSDQGETVANKPKITKNTDLGVPTQATYAIDASSDMLVEQISQLPAVPKPEDQEAIYLAMGRMAQKFSTVLTEYGNKLDDPGIEDKAQSHDAVKSIADVLSQVSESFADIATKYHDANADDFERINSDKSNMAQWDVQYRGDND
jgi:hypothetical protein